MADTDPLRVGDPLPIQTVLLYDANGVLANAGAGTLTVRLDDGSTVIPTPSPGWTNPTTGRYVPNAYLTTASGWHIARWVFTGLNSQTFEESWYVRPAFSALPWVPSLRQVATLVPGRTLGQTPNAGGPIFNGTFTATTIPTSDQVAEIIDDAVAEVMAAVGTVAGELTDTARSVAKMRAAGKVLLAYPIGGDLSAGQSWLNRSDAALLQLVEQNEVLVPGTGGATSVLSAYSFPDPADWADSPIW